MFLKAKVPSKVQIYAWSLALSKLNTCDVIQRQNLNVCLSPSWFVMCKRNGESVDHLFLYCHNAVQIWNRLFQAAKIFWVMSASSMSMLSEFIHAVGKGKKARVLWKCSVWPLVGLFGLKEIEGFLKIQGNISSFCGKECGY